MFKIAFYQVSDMLLWPPCPTFVNGAKSNKIKQNNNFHVNLRKNEGFLTSSLYIPISEYGTIIPFAFHSQAHIQRALW